MVMLLERVTEQSLRPTCLPILHMVYQVAETEKTILFAGRERVGEAWRALSLKEGVGLWEDFLGP